MEKSIRKTTVFVLCFGLVCLASALWLANLGQGADLLAAVTMPFDLLGRGMRTLALSGQAGVVVTWVLYVLIGLAPLTIPIVRLFRKKKLCLADILCVASSLYMFFYLFLLINPTYVAGLFHPLLINSRHMGSAILLMLFLSLTLSTAILHALKETNGRKTLKNIRVLVVVMACIGIFSVCFSGAYELQSALVSIQDKRGEGFLIDMPKPEIEGDPAMLEELPKEVIEDILGATPKITGEESLLPVRGSMEAGCDTADILLLLLRYLIGALSTVFLLRIVRPVLRLLYHMEADFYSDKNVTLSKTIVRRTKCAIVVAVFASVGFNLLQFLLARVATDVHFETVLPVLQLLIAFVMLFLSEYFARSTKLHDENQQFV